MKSFKLAIVLLILIIAGSIVYIYSLNNASNILVSEISNLEDSVKSSNWDSAEKQVDTLQNKWNKTEKWMSTLIDHQEIDSIQLTLAKLTQYVHEKETTDIMAESASLKLLIKHIPGKEKVDLTNLL